MLKRVSIQNFKSLKDVTLDLQKVNLLIGPNNSGKTNFLKALEYMALFEVDKNNAKVNIPADYIFGGDSDDPFETIDVKLHLIFNSIDHTRFDQTIVKKTNEGYVLGEVTTDTTDWFNGPIGKKSMLWLSWHLKNSYIYKIDSNKLVDAYPLIPDNEIVTTDASNIIAYLDNIRDKYPDTFYRIQNDLTRCVPEFSQIRFDNVKPSDSLLKLYGDKTYKLLGLYSHKLKKTYWSKNLSEGTLYFLALLCIINQPNPPKILLLEEPEKGIHPRRIFEVVQFIFRLAEEKDVQVIMTTHSPIVVDMFKDMPESVFIFDKDDEGATHVKNLQHDVIEPEIKKSKELGIEPPHYTDSLGDAWTVGFLGGVPK